MLIFLDIDGVMVSGATWKAPETLEDGFPMFLEKAVKSLNSLITTDSKIILITSHRDRFTLPEWKQLFSRRGIQVNEFDKFPYPHVIISLKLTHVFRSKLTHPFTGGSDG